MGRRSRKRSSGLPVRASPRPRLSEPAPTPTAAPGPPRRRARSDEAPHAPWHPFPLVELAIFVGLILGLVGFFTRGTALLATGLVLVTLGALEVAIREHVAGFRSHSALLAGLAAAAVLSVGLVTQLPRVVVLVVAVVVGGTAFWALRGFFARRAGGLSFRACS